MIQARSAVILSVVVAFAILAPRAHAQTAADSTAIKQAARDYIEGWYEGNAERMERALHPELAKRIVNTDPRNGRNSLGQQGAMTLVINTRAGRGKETPVAEQRNGAGPARRTSGGIRRDSTSRLGDAQVERERRCDPSRQTGVSTRGEAPGRTTPG